MNALPTGTVTFLFTDLEGSTRLWEEHPDDMRVALARHDEILRKTVDAHDGAIVKTTGDGLHAAFATANLAIASALAAQAALGAESWPLPEPLRVRMGVHTGAGEERDGDYYGPAVNRAARVAAAAHGGQILVSHVSEELARDALPSGATLRDLGEHRLRDLARGERMFQLTAPGLPADFPPPRGIDTYPGNLPVQLSSFIGREDDVTSLADALRTARLVTLTGVGGVGKTRLAIQVAAELLPHFPHGAWLCELAAVSDADALDQLLAATLGIRLRASGTLHGSILEFLAPKELLVVLDNCEHLLDEAGTLAESLLRACPKVRILATSREGLGIEGEHLRVVRSLALPNRSADIDAIAASDATRLFLDRAHATQGDGALDDATMRDVAEICRRLDGIPLAIELAAARTAAMAPNEIASRLDERFRLLTGGRRTAVERHHTLRATVDWSYSLLPDRERVVFDRLGAFSGSFDLAAAEAVAAGDDLEAWDIVDALTDLVAKSMAVREPRTDTTRFTLLETLRQYARERLDERDEADVVRRRHASNYVQVAAEIQADLRSADEIAARTRLGDDLDNIRAAVTWAFDRDGPDDRTLGLLIVAHLTLQATNDRTIGVGTWARRACDLVHDAEPSIRCAVIAAAAEDLRGRSEFDAALELARSVVDDATPIGDGLLTGLTAIGSVVASRGQPDVALDETLRVKARVDEADSLPFHRAQVAVLAAIWAGFGGHAALAEQLANEALAIARTEGTPSLLATATVARGNALHDTDPDEALRCYEESIAHTRSGATAAGYSTALSFASLLWHRAGDSALGLQRAIECVETMWAIGDYTQVPDGLASGAVILLDRAELEAAATLLGGSEQPLIAMPPISEQDARWNLAEVRSQLRSRLGHDSYEAARRRGAEMPTDEFVVYAIAEMRRVRDTIT